MMNDAMMKIANPQFPRTTVRRGFTLTELLIAVGLAMLVLYGVNRVFTATSDTIGTGSALSEANRTLRAVEGNLSSDFNPQINPLTGAEVPGTGILPSVTAAYDHKQPAIAIRVQEIAAFNSKADREADVDGAVGTYDPTNSGTEIPIPTIGNLGARRHRIDTVSFFISGKVEGSVGVFTGSFRRQTGQINSGRETLVTDLEKPLEHAWVWYGHTRLPDDPASLNLLSSNYRQPGTTGSKNEYAADWVLGRRATVISDREDYGQVAYEPGFVNDANGVPMYYYRDAAAPAGIPVGFGTTGTGASGDIASPASGPLAFVNTNGANDARVAATDPNGATLLQSSIYDLLAIVDGIGIVPTGLYAPATGTGVYGAFNTGSGAAANFWQAITQDRTATGPAFRFNANPFVGAPLITQGGALPASFKTALNSPILARACTQFIVEFAGDMDSSGQIDVRTAGGVSGIQWYGLPRYVDGGVGDVIMPPAGPYLVRNDSATAVPTAAFVWGPAELAAGPRPSLIRITVTIVDTNNRLQDGMTREFVYRVR